jgi:hypothetical protein
MFIFLALYLSHIFFDSAGSHSGVLAGILRYALIRREVFN